MNVLGLCAGAGGLELGIRIAEPESRCVAMVEREAYAAAILVARMEDQALDPAPIWSDLGTFDGRPWRGVVDCIISGDPCQPFSVAGQQGGTEDTRWLGEHVIRIIDEVRPSRVFRENVPGGAAEQLAFFVPALERLGYRVAAGIFSAAEVSGAHRRQRLFIMADREGWRKQKQPKSDYWGSYESPKSKRLIAGTSGRSNERDSPQRIEKYKRTAETVARTMAHSPRLQRGTVQRGKPDGTGGGVGNAQRPEWRPSQPAGHVTDGHDARWPQETSGAGKSGEAVADRQNQRHERSGTPRGRRPKSEDHGGTMADCICIGLEGQRTDTEAIGREDAGRSAGLCHGTMLFAPGPTDPRWPDILRDHPHLEPAVRRMADGMANRVDRLRACGNGVFPMAAAFAWASLDALLAQADTTQPVLTAVE